MPYRTNAALPDSVKGALPAEAQTIWRTVFNSQAKRGLSEERAFASAWSAIKENWEKDKDSGKWHKVEKMALAWELPITKADDTHQLVFGWASIAVTKDGAPVIDLQGDLIDIDELEHAFYAYVKESRALNFHHAGATRGELIEAVVFTPEKLAAMGIPEGTVPLGAWVGYHIPDLADYAEAKQEGLVMFSIEGSAIREAV